jgi:hypothetical protein
VAHPGLHHTHRFCTANVTKCPTQDRKQASRDKDSVLRVIPTSMKSALRNTFLNFGKLPKGETQHIGLNKATLSLYQ